MLANAYSMIILALRMSFLLLLCSSACAAWPWKDQGPINLGSVQIFNEMQFPATQFTIYKCLMTYDENQSTEYKQRDLIECHICKSQRAKSWPHGGHWPSSCWLQQCQAFTKSLCGTSICILLMSTYFRLKFPLVALTKP